MPQNVDTIDPKEVTVMIADNIIEGFADAKILVERESDAVIDEAGPDGDVARLITNDFRGTFTITLLQTSRSNLILSRLAKADALSGNGIFPVVIKDNRGNDLHIGATSWIRKMPASAYSKSVETRVWAIRTSNLNQTVGGAA